MHFQFGCEKVKNSYKIAEKIEMVHTMYGGNASHLPYLEMHPGPCNSTINIVINHPLFFSDLFPILLIFLFFCTATISIFENVT
jgi:hypothetical protein